MIFKKLPPAVLLEAIRPNFQNGLVLHLPAESPAQGQDSICKTRLAGDIEMQSTPIGSELDSSTTPRSLETSASNTASGNSLALFLIGTGIAPLVLVGKSMQSFGLRPVIGFVLGAAMMYGYALFKPLPYIPKPLSAASTLVATQSLVEREPPAKPIRLHGVVQDRDGRPVKEPFMVGVLMKRVGPLRNSDGSFAIDVPKSSSYDLALWNMGGKMVQVYDGYSVERDGDGYMLPPMLFTEPLANTTTPDPRPIGRTLQARSSGQ